jgi:hypothetical protein
LREKEIKKVVVGYGRIWVMRVGKVLDGNNRKEMMYGVSMGMGMGNRRREGFDRRVMNRKIREIGSEEGSRGLNVKKVGGCK